MITQQSICTIFDTTTHINGSTEQLSAIRQLYIECYSKGTSAQFIDTDELNIYLKEILQFGTALLISDDNMLKACLIYTPLSFDKLCPDTVVSDFQPEKCVYIAEVMVAEQHRAKGLGKRLLVDFFDSVDKNKYKDVFLRVLDENIPALNLYQKMGFERCASIRQKKKSPDGKSDFYMTKIYLHKNLS